MKHCPYCKKDLQKWGTTSKGTNRYYCMACKRTAVAGKRKDITDRHLRRELDIWLGGKDSMKEIAAKYHVTRQTFWRHLRPYLSFAFEPQIPQSPPMKILILDGTYIHGHILCALVAIDENDRIFWRFTNYESLENWKNFLSEFPEPEVIVMDGQKGLFAAAKSLWPKVRVQRCQFHVVSFALQYLGRRPKDEAGKEMLHLLYQLKTVKDARRRDLWVLLFHSWEMRHEKMLKSREGKKFANQKLRSVRLIIQKVMPYLFTYIEIPGVPNTTNLVEGWVNGAVAEALRRHRGLREHEKRTLVSIILSHLKRGGDTSHHPKHQPDA